MKKKNNDTMHNIVVLKFKLIKLEISPERIDRIKKFSFIILIYVLVKVSQT